MSTQEASIKLEKQYYQSPIGSLLLTAVNDKLISLGFDSDENALEDHSDTMIEGLRQLSDYFQKKSKSFDLMMSVKGTELQMMVWKALNNVPYGSTVSYSEFAKSLNLPHATRAVANAVGRNPLPIIIPCHRVVGINGKLTGYIGGVDRKRWLIDFEHGQQSMF